MKNQLFAACGLSLVPIRKEATSKSEMVSQLLFGDLVIISRAEGEWVYVTCQHDSYKGWINTKQLLGLSKEEYNFYHENNYPQYFSKNSLLFDLESKTKCILSYGSSLCLDPSNRIVKLGSKKFRFVGKYIKRDKNTNIEKLLVCAKSYLGTPYLWGGRSSFGIDCSGFTQMVFRVNGINLPRDSFEQATCGKKIMDIQQIQKGDLLFFGNESGKISHVGISYDNDTIIHSSGYVRIDKIHEIVQDKKFIHANRVFK